MRSFFSKIVMGHKCKCHSSFTIRFIALHSTNGAPVQLHLPFQQIYNSNKQEGQAREENLQLELVRGARCSRAPQTNTHVNGDPLSVFDDSTLSEVSDDEGRYICSMPPFASPLWLTHKMCSDWCKVNYTGSRRTFKVSGKVQVGVNSSKFTLEGANEGLCKKLIKVNKIFMCIWNLSDFFWLQRENKTRRT